MILLNQITDPLVDDRIVSVTQDTNTWGAETSLTKRRRVGGIVNKQRHELNLKIWPFVCRSYFFADHAFRLAYNLTEKTDISLQFYIAAIQEYLQHGGIYCRRQNDVAITPCVKHRPVVYNVALIHRCIVCYWQYMDEYHEAEQKPADESENNVQTKPETSRPSVIGTFYLQCVQLIRVPTLALNSKHE